MTFEEWLAEQENCQPTDWNDAKSVYRFWIEVARRAWKPDMMRALPILILLYFKV